MTYLIDTNVWLDLLLERAGRDDVRLLLDTIPNRLLVTTDFAMNATGIFVAKRNPIAFYRFIEDLIRNEIGVVHLPTSLFRDVLETMSQHSLTFDDSFQYVASIRFDLRIVSFDTDFDHTPRGRLTPAQAVEHYRSGLI